MRGYATESGLAVRLATLLVGTAGLLTAARPAGAQSEYLQSGPMVGYSTMREVLLWAQTNRPAEVRFIYYDTEAPQRRYSTATVRTVADRAYTAKLVADSVQPGRRYAYELYLDGQRVERPYPLRFQTPVLWQWRTDPPPFRLVIGSCNYVIDPPYDRPGDPYGGNYEIFTRIFEQRPDVMLWLGDNAYLREADWNSRTGILYRYTHTRSLPELQPLLASTHHYAIWDDHDFGPDNSDRSYGRKGTTLEAFELFWGNPCSGADGRPGIACSFGWSDVEFFLLDNRYYRSPNDRVTGERTMLGREQLEWLIDALVDSQATFKIIAIGSQVLNPQPASENYSKYPEERAVLLEAIGRERIEGVLFLTGDRHRTELSRLDRPGTYPLYDLTVSPLTADLASEIEENELRIAGTLLVERNFAILDFQGPPDDRRMTIRVVDKDGQERWTRTIPANDLR